MTTAHQIESGRGPVERGDLVSALTAAGVGDVDDSPLTRSLYATDASLYRVPPRAVVAPRHSDEVAAVLAVCTQMGVPLTMRGGGTSIAGNAVGPGVVVDVGRHLNRVIEVDPDAGTALVEPGVVLDDLQAVVRPHGWRFGPDPSTHDRATLGGMIGNNACGSRALGYGRTSDNVAGLDVLTGTGHRLLLGDVGGEGRGEAALLRELRQTVGGNLGTIRTELGRFGRQISGYSLEHLLPERGFDVARALVGTEGTLALTLAARVVLVRDSPLRVLVVLGYPSMAEAADAVPAVLAHHPIACEGLDARITDIVRARRGPGAVPTLPRGSGWLMVELAGTHRPELEVAADRVAADAGALDSLTVLDPRQMAALWRIREDGAGLVSRTSAGEPALSGWEDAAVPPQELGSYLRAFEALLVEHGLTGVPYGHFGDGCVHVRIDFPFSRDQRPRVFRDFLTDAADLVARHGGSMSGEHGDGRARSELLPRMYSAAAMGLFEEVKAIFDPADVLNPGVLVRPAPVDADLRGGSAAPVRRQELPSLGFGYRHDRGDVSMAAHRCTGVGKCRADPARSGGTGVMCPSFLATHEEKDSTRGRARVLQDVVSGHLGPDGWRSPALHEALDLCLACKGCASDCPTGVDMATLKAEALHQSYRGRVRPRAHYALGWLPSLTRMVSRTPVLARVFNLAAGSMTLRPLLAWAAGIDARRDLPTLATTPFRRWFAGREPSASSRLGEVVLFVDTFSDAFSPHVARSAVAVLEAAGYRVLITERSVCCGLTWISTGQLDVARRRLTATVRELAPLVAGGRLVVGLEPSCTGVLRSDALELLEGEDLVAARTVASATRTIAELLTETPGWVPPSLAGVTGIAQPHCHHHAVLGWERDEELLRAAGAEIRRLGGCCGLAGNFGVERGHFDVSVAVAELQLLPAVRQTRHDEVVLADGFSCRTQLAALGDRQSVHLVELLDRHTGGSQS